MLQRLRRSMRRKKASYCVNCGHLERECYHGDFAGQQQQQRQFNSLPNRRSLRASQTADLFLTYDELVSW